ncbi:AGL165Wp [Eremothecium gossypii ATCC 10895]|uniref:Proline dehydrogenase n=1 Tax=Eremothecium gossypii (strain ATCC 10895 / CBS 109.51 / FGSC 9923 / NRRL Y-1056) TaxID=284811 RepID=Q750V4_EREGS|nr:AGL165Wp [Eremothecium gossypii ATCC 10895]AAS54326.1 AGL165Wp [Eremothecium gossypii ATCC 10895]AEY98652.1 FAGL165Wp [Eremothecium gossypii FDAG1]
MNSRLGQVLRQAVRVQTGLRGPARSMRGYVSQTQTKQNTVAVVAGAAERFVAPAADAHLKTLSQRELVALGVIGCVTTNARLLKLVTQAFPYVPTPVAKLLISALYCGGDTMAEVRETGRALARRGVGNMMLSLTVEDSEGTKNIDIDYIVEETVRSLHGVLLPHMEEQLARAADVNSVPPGYLALKPSALVSDPANTLLHFADPAWREKRDALVANFSRIVGEVYKLNQEMLARYPGRKSPFFVATIDAEKYEVQCAGVYELQRLMFAKYNPVSSPIVSCIGTWQLYLRDAAADLVAQAERAEREGYKLGLKLVRGAYLHSEPNRDVIHPTKEATDEHYNEVMAKVIQDLLANGEHSVFGHLVVASHNYQSQMLATMLLQAHGESVGKSNVVLGQLLGMADNVTYDLIHNHGARNIIKYVPWGPPKETKDYMHRRLQENGDAVRADNGWPLVKAVCRALFYR